MIISQYTAYREDEFQNFVEDILRHYCPSNLESDGYRGCAELIREGFVDRRNPLYDTIEEVLWFVPEPQRMILFRTINDALL